MKFFTMFPLFLHFVTLLLSVSTISHGLTLKLIPPSSPESPFYLGNLSYWERAHFYVRQSNARVHYLSSRALALAHTNSYSYSNSSQPSVISPPVDVQHWGLYSVKIGIGGFPTGGGHQMTFKSYYLVMDTGSDLLWLQCDGCKTHNKCFPQQGEPPFRNHQSKTYKAIECAANHAICAPYSCKDKLCHYTIEYGDDTHSEGKLAYEFFTFEADHHGKLLSKKLRFGCGEDQEKVSFAPKDNNKLAGILGLSSGKDALQMQLPETDQKFSYCLPHKNTHPQHQTYLTFGSDIPQTPGFLKTRMTTDRSEQYLISLLDVSIDHKKLSIPLKQQSIAMSVDSGSSITRLIKPVYEVLEKALVSLFSGDPNLRRTGDALLCYERVQPEREPYSRLPTLTFNLEGVDFEIGPDAAFEAEVGRNGKQNFCLMIESNDEYTILGAYQQSNYRFIYDLKGQQLLFKKEKC